LNESTTPSPIVSLTNVHYIRNKKAILSDVNWSIERGQHWALLGANGSGKTTVLKIVTGYEWPSRGEVCVLGHRFGQCDIRELRKSIGWVSTALEQKVPRQLTATQVVASGIDASIGVYRDFTPDEESRVIETLETVNASPVADRAFGLLSQGEQQRVLIARALIIEPRLLILDEPCAGLDPTARHQFLDDMGSLSSGHDAPTLIFVTHHIEEIRPWITKVLAISEGSIAAKGSREEVLCDQVLGRVFNTQCEVHKTNGEFHLTTNPPARD